MMAVLSSSSIIWNISFNRICTNCARISYEVISISSDDMKRKGLALWYWIVYKHVIFCDVDMFPIHCTNTQTHFRFPIAGMKIFMKNIADLALVEFRCSVFNLCIHSSIIFFRCFFLFQSEFFFGYCSCSCIVHLIDKYDLYCVSGTYTSYIHSDALIIIQNVYSIFMQMAYETWFNV